LIISWSLLGFCIFCKLRPFTSDQAEALPFEIAVLNLDELLNLATCWQELYGRLRLRNCRVRLDSGSFDSDRKAVENSFRKIFGLTQQLLPNTQKAVETYSQCLSLDRSALFERSGLGPLLERFGHDLPEASEEMSSKLKVLRKQYETRHFTHSFLKQLRWGHARSTKNVKKAATYCPPDLAKSEEWSRMSQISQSLLDTTPFIDPNEDYLSVRSGDRPNGPEEDLSGIMTAEQLSRLREYIDSDVPPPELLYSVDLYGTRCAFEVLSRLSYMNGAAMTMSSELVMKDTPPLAARVVTADPGIIPMSQTELVHFHQPSVKSEEWLCLSDICETIANRLHDATTTGQETRTSVSEDGQVDMSRFLSTMSRFALENAGQASFRTDRFKPFTGRLV
jgi:hypothetical protein